MSNDREDGLVEFCQQFKTQGNRHGDYWFLGIEEGGGGSFESVDAMLASWERRDRREETVLHEPENPDPSCKWFGTTRPGGPPIQTTWGAQIRILLSMLGLPSDREDVRRYQASQFGTPAGQTCLMELLPLPNPGLAHWVYNEVSSLPEFASRDALIDHLMEKRIARLRELIDKHEPVSLVGVCYGLRHFLEPHLDDIERVCASTGSPPGRATIGNIGRTVVAITYHPSTPMSGRNDWYAELGQIVAARSDQLCSEPLRYQLPLPLAA